MEIAKWGSLAWLLQEYGTKNKGNGDMKEDVQKWLPQEC
jgi:hypothetical protein